MNILFVCCANAGRSQVAEALFNRLSQHRAKSTGTEADELLAKRNPATSMVKDATLFQLSSISVSTFGKCIQLNAQAYQVSM